MPIYEYECRACGHEFEVMQKMSEPVLVDCPDCDRPTLKKLISPVAFRLKGTGWYETDFKNNQKTTDISNQPSENGSKSDKSSTKEAETSSKPSTGTSDDTSSNSHESKEPKRSPKA